MSFIPVNRRDMIDATRAALARLGLVNRTQPVAPPPSPVPLEDEEEVITDEEEVNSEPSTPPHQIMDANPIYAPPVGRPQRRERLERDDLRPRVLNYNEAPRTPGNQGVRSQTNRDISPDLQQYFPAPRKGKLNFPGF